MQLIERGEAPHHRIGASQGLHRPIGTAVRRAERDQAAQAAALGRAERAARDQAAHAVGDDQERVGRIGAQPREKSGTEIGQVQAPVVVMHDHGKSGGPQPQLQGEVTEGQGAERHEAGCLRKPQPVQTAFDDVLRVEPDQVGRLGAGGKCTQLGTHDAGQQVQRRRVPARRARRDACQVRQQRVVGGAKHRAEFAARGAGGQQAAQLFVAVPQPVVDRGAAARGAHARRPMPLCRMSSSQKALIAGARAVLCRHTAPICRVGTGFTSGSSRRPAAAP